MVGYNARNVLFSVNGGVNAVLNCISLQPGVRANEIAGSLDMAQRTVERLIKQLRDEGRIE